LIPLLIFLLSCTSNCTQTTEVTEYRATQSFEQRCSPPALEQRTVSLAEIVSPSTEPEQPLSATPRPAVFSWRILQIADAIGVLPLLKQMPFLDAEVAQHQEGREIRLLKTRQQILGRILLGMLEVSGTTAHLGCEEERAHQLADRLQKAEGARVRQQTLLGVIFGGLANIAAGAFGIAVAGDAGNIASIIFGAASTAFGSAALYPETKQDYETSPNLLREIWEGPEESTLFPKSGWRFLNRPINEEAGGRTFREELIAGWQQEGRLGEPGSRESRQRKQLLFAERGEYSGQDLLVRSQMLDMLKSASTS